MAVRALQLSVVFTIGFYFGPVAPSTVATNVTDIPIELSLRVEDPKDVVIGKGQSAELRCKAQSSTKEGVRFRWLYNDELIPLDDTRWKQFENGTLYIPVVVRKRYNSSLEGGYRCLANTSAGSVLSNPASVTVASFARNFSEHPKDTQVIIQQPAVLRCQIHSTPPAKIQWERNDLPLPQSTRYVPLSTGVLLITSTHSSDTGYYRCKARNDKLKKTKQSNYANLTVLSDDIESRPQFLPLSDSDNVTVLVGQNLTLYCPATGSPLPTVHWTNHAGVVVQNASAMTLRNVNATDAGNYTCSASNFLGQVVKNFSVQVFQKPTFKVSPTSKQYPPAKTVRLFCQAEGIPTPEIRWLKNGTLLLPKETLKIEPSGLVISHSFTTDAGMYQCVATNRVGSVWKAAQLVPMFKSPGPPPAHFVCRPHDDTSICLQWSTPPHGIEVQAYSVHSFLAGIPGQEIITNNTHVLATDLQRDSNYTFFVRLYSNKASDPSEKVWCKTGELGKRNLKIRSESNSSVRLTWDAMSNDIPCGKSTGSYKIQWRKTGSQFSNVDHSEDFAHVVKGLQPSSTYEFRVSSLSNVDEDGPWVPFTIAAADDGGDVIRNRTISPPSPVPENLEVQILTPTSLNLTWSQLGVDVFDVCYVEVRSLVKCEDGHVLRSSHNYIEVKNLKPTVCYELKVRARETDGILGPFSHSLEVCMTTNVLSPAVEKLQYRLVNATTACVSWYRPRETSAKINGYLIKYSTLSLENWLTQSVNFDDESGAVCSSEVCLCEDEDVFGVVLTKLIEGQNYTVIVHAKSESGLGKPAVVVMTNVEGSNKSLPHDDVYRKQKLGIILGLVLALICVACCASTLFFRRRCVKRRALARSRLASSSNNYYQTPLQVVQETSVPVQMEEPCVTQAHELQQLMSVEGTTHIPPVSVTHLDTKGGATFPNGQMNGTAKFLKNGFLANGHVHITENPQYHDDDDSIELTYMGGRPKSLKLYREDSNSNLQNPKLQDLEQLYKKSKIHLNGDLHNGSASSNSDSSLDRTRLTCLEDSVLSNRRRLSPVVGPDG